MEAFFKPDPDYDWDSLGWPEPVSIAGNVYQLDHFASDTPAGTYPDHMVFLQTDRQDPTLEDSLTDHYIMAYNLESRSRFAGLGESGIGMINTSNPQENGGGYLGGVVLALNTMDAGRVEVTFDAGTVLPNSRPYGLRLRARTGIDREWQDLLDEEGNPIDYIRSDNAGHSSQFGPFDLPADHLGEPYIQLKWRYHALPTDVTGPRAFLRLDNVEVRGYKDPIGWMLY